MIKYAITSECMNKCEYCIDRNVQCKEEACLPEVAKTLLRARKLDNTIMLTGGEPTLSPQFYEKVIMASEIFDEVYLTTASQRYMTSPQMANEHIDAITFTIHFPQDISTLTDSGIFHRRVYSAIVWPQLKRIINNVPELINIGFKGLTINEDQRGTETFDESVLPDIENFSYKINRRGHCLENTTIIFPDLEVVTDFWEWV